MLQRAFGEQRTCTKVGDVVKTTATATETISHMFDPMYAGWARMSAPYFWPALGLAAVSLALAVVLWMWGGGRRFGRRNFAGVEEFGNYGSAVGSRLIESLADLLASALAFVFLLSSAVVIFCLAFRGFIGKG